MAGWLSLSFLPRCWSSNSGSHPCAASTLLIEPSPALLPTLTPAFIKKKKSKLGMVMHAFNLSTRETEAEASLVYWSTQ